MKRLAPRADPAVRSAPCRVRDAAGSTLLEVLAALVVLSITLIAILGPYVAVRASVERAAAGLLAGATAGGSPGLEGGFPGGREMWSWSSVEVCGADWESGGLRLQVEAHEAEAEVGWWVDGWFGGAVPVPDGGSAVSLSTLSPERASGEITVRGRVAGGSWGIPWRVSLPSRGGEAVGDPGWMAGSQVQSSEGAAAVAVIVHGPTSGRSDVWFVGTGRAAVKDVLTPHTLAVWGGGGEVGCGERTQRAPAVRGGVYHAYF